jgi:hypothetical protein
MDYKILRPIGPALYYTQLDSSVLDLLADVCKSSREAKVDFGKTLAGNLEHQWAAIFNSEQRSQFLKEMHEHIFSALVEMDKESNIIFKTVPDKNVVRYNLGDGPWINFQQPGEFNPYHDHSGQLSAVIYISVPEEIEKENTELSISTNMPSAGKICFVYGSDGFGIHSSYAHPPKTGEMFIFPACLKHLVYPYKSNVERISMSFNVHNIVTQ